MDKAFYNRIGQIIITEDVHGDKQYRSYSLSKREIMYDLTAERLLSQENIEYLSKKGITIHKAYESAEEIQKIIDALDDVHYQREYIPEIEDTDDMYVTGIYEYLGATNEHFIHGKQYYCTADSEYVFILIGEDQRNYDCDKRLFKKICTYHSLNPMVYVYQSERAE